MAYNNMITRSNAEALIPVETSAEIFQAVAERSAVLSLMRRLPNMSTGTRNLPVASAMVSAGFVEGDAGLKPTSSAAWDNKQIVAEEIAVIVPIPENVLNDASYDIWAQIRPQIVEAFGRILDGAVLFGTDAPASWPTGIVPDATTATRTVTAGTGVDLVDDLNSLMGQVEESGYEVTGFAAAPTFKGSLRGLRDQIGGLLYQPSLTAGTPDTLYGQPIFTVRNGAWDGDEAVAIAGDWSQAVYAFRQDLTYKVLDQAVITDGDGNIVYNLAQQDMVALRVKMRVGWQVPNPINALDGTSTRYPFAVLLPEDDGGLGG